jgi:hypothetical protein
VYQVLRKVLPGPWAVLLLAIACSQDARAADLKPQRAAGDIVAVLRAEAGTLAGSAMLSKDAAFWSAAARAQAAMANLDLLFEDDLAAEFKDLDAVRSRILIDLAAAIGKVGGEDPPSSVAIAEIQERIAKAIEKRWGRPMPQVLAWSPHAMAAEPGQAISVVLLGRDFDKSFYVPELSVKDAKGKEQWLPPSRSGAGELVYEIPAAYVGVSEQQITRFRAEVEFTVKTGGFLGLLRSEKTWRNPISVLLLPSRFVSVSGALLISQGKQDAWRTSPQVCHSDDATAERIAEHTCFQPQAGFKIDPASSAYAVERTYKVLGRNDATVAGLAGGCDLAVDAEHQATADRICMVCERPAEDADVVPCAKLRWKEVQTELRNTEMPLSQFVLSARNPSRRIALPAGRGHSFRLRLDYFNGDTVDVDGPYQDDWVQVVLQPQLNVLEVRMPPKVLFD